MERKKIVKEDITEIDFSESNDEDNSNKEAAEIITKEKINFELTSSEIIIKLIDTKEILLKKKYSMEQKLFAHSEQLNKFIYLDCSNTKYVFHCSSALTRDLILNSYFNFRELFLKNNNKKKTKLIKKKVIKNQIKLISPKNVCDKFDYQSNQRSIYHYILNENNHNGNGNNSNQKYATYEIQFYNSLEEHIGPGEILLYNDHFIVNFYSEKIARYYSAYSKPLLFNQKSVLCRFHIDEKEYVNIAFSTLKQRNTFIKGFNTRFTSFINISNYATRSIYKSIILKNSGEMIPIKIILRFNCFILKSNLSILRCEYLPNTDLNVSKIDSSLVSIKLGLGYSSIKCLFQNDLYTKQFITSFEMYKSKWLIGSFENPCYYYKNIKLLQHIKNNVGGNGKHNNGGNRYEYGNKNKNDDENVEIIFTNNRMVLIKKKTQPIILKNYNLYNSQIFLNSDHRNISKIILKNKTKLLLMFNSEKENVQFNAAYKKINNILPSNKNKLNSLTKKIILDYQTNGFKSKTSIQSSLSLLTFHIEFLNKKFSKEQGILKLFPKYMIIHNDKLTVHSKIDNVNIMLNPLNHEILEISFKKYSFLIKFCNPKHRQYFIYKFGSIKKLQIPNYIPTGKEFPILSFKYGNDQTISKNQSLPLYIKLLKNKFTVIFENEFFKQNYKNLRIVIDQQNKCNFQIFQNQKIKFKGSLPDEHLNKEFVSMFIFFEELSSINDTFLRSLSNFGKNLNHKKIANFDSKNENNSHFDIKFINKEFKVLSEGRIIVDHLNHKLIFLNLPNRKKYLQFVISDGISLLRSVKNKSITSIIIDEDVHLDVQFISPENNIKFVSKVQLIKKHYQKALSQFIKNRNSGLKQK
ncbi:hypothetical protein M0813_09336 [Anaeramoeba flamelloides]|uniref:Uncharacterized protein n=1 Tax=Anaeramoeba flamelloides TaxID=1746091 RepID=A0ABQ8X5I0_9EUKA|nr:hypothetical protein M0813_09336 [Anaeramoeba flamelloides]